MRHPYRLLLAALLSGTAVLPPSLANAADGTVTVLANGQEVSVGSVAAVGQLENGACVYDPPVTITMTTASSGARTTLAADDDCRLVVTVIDAIREAPAAPGTTRRQIPKHNRWAGGLATNNVDPGVVQIGLGDVTTDGLDVVYAALDAASNTETRIGRTQQTMSSAVGVEWDDAVALHYVYNKSSRSVWSAYDYYPGSYCAVNNSIANVAAVNDTDPDDCRIEGFSASQGNYAATSGGGRYMQHFGLVDLYPTNVTEEFVAYGSQISGGCSHDLVPPGWSYDCSYWYERVAS